MRNFLKAAREFVEGLLISLALLGGWAYLIDYITR